MTSTLPDSLRIGDEVEWMAPGSMFDWDIKWAGYLIGISPRWVWVQPYDPALQPVTVDRAKISRRRHP